MPTPTYTPLATVTLGSSASSVTFSSIPATYRDLILVVDGTTSATNVGMAFRANGDTGPNYATVIMAGNGSVTSTVAGSAAIYADVLYAADTSKFNGIIQIMDYSATDKHKSLLTRSNQGGTFVLAYASRWANTAAITTVNLLTATSSWAAGTTFSLYGVIA